MSVMNNERRHTRVPVGITMDIRTSAGEVCRGAISDLSDSGMTFESDAVLEEGQSLYLKMDTPLEIRGEIRHIRPSDQGGMTRYGVRFHFIAMRAPRPSAN
ncbi:MAG: hypothetical protein COB53_12645 [Elusimicrobia bacterium]|nr:MAG: hypothetical protein COB53_12645 [Elusimicrobiota bacterium]